MQSKILNKPQTLDDSYVEFDLIDIKRQTLKEMENEHIHHYNNSISYFKEILYDLHIKSLIFEAYPKSITGNYLRALKMYEEECHTLIAAILDKEQLNTKIFLQDLEDARFQDNIMRLQNRRSHEYDISIQALHSQRKSIEENYISAIHYFENLEFHLRYQSYEDNPFLFVSENELLEKVNAAQKKYKKPIGDKRISEQAFLWVARKEGCAPIYILNTCHTMNIDPELIFGKMLDGIISEVDVVFTEIKCSAYNQDRSFIDKTLFYRFEELIAIKSTIMKKSLKPLENENIREIFFRIKNQKIVENINQHPLPQNRAYPTASYLTHVHETNADTNSDYIYFSNKNRNLFWMESILSTSKNQSALVVCGCAHSAKKYGLPNLLTAEGYELQALLTPDDIISHSFYSIAVELEKQCYYEISNAVDALFDLIKSCQNQIGPINSIYKKYLKDTEKLSAWYDERLKEQNEYLNALKKNKNNPKVIFELNRQHVLTHHKYLDELKNKKNSSWKKYYAIPNADLIIQTARNYPFNESDVQNLSNFLDILDSHYSELSPLSQEIDAAQTKLEITEKFILNPPATLSAKLNDHTGGLIKSSYDQAGLFNAKNPQASCTVIPHLSSQPENVRHYTEF